MHRFHSFWKTLGTWDRKPIILDSKAYKNRFYSMLYCIQENSNREELAFEFRNISKICLWNTAEGEFERIDNFLSMNWEIFYCYWQLWTLVYKNVGFYFPKFEFQGIGNSGLVELTKKTLFISKSLEELQLNNRPENHLFFYVMPALFKRAGLKSSRVIFENIESLEDIRFFLVENLWTLLLGTFRSEMPIKTALREIIIPKKRILWQRILGYLQNQEINNTDHDPFFWFFLYGVSSFFPYEKEDRINLREIAEKIIKQFYNTSLGKEDVIYKILNKVLQKKLVFKTKFYFWKRTSSLIPRVYNKLKFRFVHSLFLSILLLLVLIFLNIFIYFIVQEKNFLAILKKITADLILFENSFNK